VYTVLPFDTIGNCASVCVEEKGWERVAAAQKEADLMVAEYADSIYFSDPANRRKPA
jgi:hypothetical protein